MSKNRIYAEAGFQAGVKYKSWVEYNSESNGPDVRIKEYNKDLINPIDVDSNAGIGYRF